MYKVLVVEDDAVVSKTTEHILRKVGYEVRITSDADIAFELLNSTGFDVLIVDLKLLHSGERKLIEKVRSDLATGNRITSILVTTTNNMVPYMATLIETGVSDYLQKPFSPEELIYRVKRVLKDRVILPIE